MTDANRPIIDPGTGEIIDGWVAHPAADLFPMAQADELDACVWCAGGKSRKGAQ